MRWPWQKPLTAAVASPTRKSHTPTRGDRGWQIRAWKIWRQLGEMHYATTFMARQMTRLRWDVSVDGEEVDRDDADELIRAVTDQDPGGVARDLSLHMTVAGEAWYIRNEDGWRIVPSTATSLKSKLDDADVVVHGIRRDPEKPSKPDSPVRASLGVAEELLTLQALNRSQNRNRLAQRGVILVPNDAGWDEADEFQDAFEEAAVAPLQDEHAPSAVTPLIVDFPSELIETWRHFTADSDFDDDLDERIDDALRRLALSLDIPPEVLLGIADLNHWSAWAVEDSTYRQHLEPTALRVGRIFADALEAVAETLDVAGEIEVEPDPAELLARRSSVQDSFEAWDRGIVGDDFVREAVGASEDDAPDEAELRRLLALEGRATQGQPLEVGPPDATTAAVEDTEDLGDRLADLDIQLRARLTGAMATALADVRDGGQVDAAVGRVTSAWRDMLDMQSRSLESVGVDTSGPQWQQARQASVGYLEQALAPWLQANADTDPAPEPPQDLARTALAVAGGSSPPAETAAISPQPTQADPYGRAVGVLTNQQLADQGLQFRQWRWRYGSAPREDPFLPHREQSGRFAAAADGAVNGWWPGDHKGCLCQLAPVYVEAESPQETGFR